jgi:myo-inositol-1(or 4)-monophosphatase
MSYNDAGLLSRIAAAKEVVLAQTDFMHREFGRAQSSWKYDGTRVTAADVAISEGIFRTLSAQFPADHFFSEELAETEEPTPLTQRFAWVLDPIDGTNNYATGIPYCAISLALLENGMPVYGVIYDMARRVLIHGGPGFGVRDGEHEVRVKTTPPDTQSMLGFHSPYDKAFSHHASALVENFKLRGLGSSTLHLAYVAIGLLDATVDHNVRIWDIAAAVPLVWAGGGEVQFLNGEQFPLRVFNLRMGRIQFIAGNTAACAALRTLLKV